MVPLLERMQAEKRKLIYYGEWYSDAIYNYLYGYFLTNLIKLRIMKLPLWLKYASLFIKILDLKI